MKDALVLLNEVDKIKKFTDTVSRFPEDIDIIHGRYVIDAKSIMGIFTLDTSKPVIVRVHSDNDEVVDNIIKNIKALGIVVD